MYICIYVDVWVCGYMGVYLREKRKTKNKIKTTRNGKPVQ